MIWSEVKALPWRKRNEIVQEELLTFLHTRPASLPPLTVQKVAKALAEDADAKLHDVITTMAPHLGERYACQPGPAFTRFGKVFKRWVWKGTAHG
jgi:hypothetical protein